MNKSLKNTLEDINLKVEKNTLKDVDPKSRQNSCQIVCEGFESITLSFRYVFFGSFLFWRKLFICFLHITHFEDLSINQLGWTNILFDKIEIRGKSAQWVFFRSPWQAGLVYKDIRAAPVNESKWDDCFVCCRVVFWLLFWLFLFFKSCLHLSAFHQEFSGICICICFCCCYF